MTLYHVTESDRYCEYIIDGRLNVTAIRPFEEWCRTMIGSPPTEWTTRGPPSYAIDTSYSPLQFSPAVRGELLQTGTMDVSDFLDTTRAEEMGFDRDVPHGNVYRWQAQNELEELISSLEHDPGDVIDAIANVPVVTGLIGHVAQHGSSQLAQDVSSELEKRVYGDPRVTAYPREMMNSVADFTGID